MPEDTSNIIFRHILVALDTSGHSRSALIAAAQLAQLSKAELRGLFVHDEQWFRIGRFPLSNEISEITGEKRKLAEKYIEKQIQLLENRIKEHMRNIDRIFDIDHKWNSVKGTIETEVLKAGKKADLITIGRTGFSNKLEDKLGRTARYIVKHSEKPVLLLEEGQRLSQSVIVIYDGTSQAKRSLDLGLKIAGNNEGELLIFGLIAPSESVKDRTREIEKKVQNADVDISLRLFKRDDILNLTSNIYQLTGGLLIIPKDQPLIKEEWIGKIFNLAQCPLLLMN